jgi:hypothetical protein
MNICGFERIAATIVIANHALQVTGDSTPKPLSMDLIRRILMFYGEAGYAADDELVTEMYYAALGDNNGISTEERDLYSAMPGYKDYPPVPSSSTSSIKLDINSFATALTHDIGLYDILSEGRMSTYFDDVFLTRVVNNPLQVRDELNKSVAAYELKDNELRDRLTIRRHINSRITASSIDIAAGTYRSKTLMVTLWACVLTTYFAYLFRTDYLETFSSLTVCKEFGFEYVMNTAWSENWEPLLCEMVTSITFWVLSFIILSIYGLTFAGLASIGNEVTCRRWWRPMVGVISVLVFVVVPFYLSNWTEAEPFNKYIQSISFILGIVVCFLHLSHTLAIIVPTKFYHKFPSFRKALYPSTVRSEKQSKMAVNHKLNNMISNALALVVRRKEETVLESHFGQGLHSFAKSTPEYETIGGFQWTWRSVWDKSLYEREGLWLSARLFASNLTQLIVCIYVLLAGISFAKRVIGNYDPDGASAQVDSAVDTVLGQDAKSALSTSLTSNVTNVFGSYLATLQQQQSIGLDCSSFTNTQDVLNRHCRESNGVYQCDPGYATDYMCALQSSSSDLDSNQQNALLQGSGIDTSSLTALSESALDQAAKQAVASLYPTELYMISIPVFIGVTIAVLTAFNLTATYAPSVVATVLKLRCGVMATLHNPDLDMYRIAPETVALLTGSLFWGCLVSSLVTGGSFGLIAFLFLWQATAYYAQRFVAIFTGIIAITLLRIGMICFCRHNYYRAFYRKDPAPANISILAFEWANFALSAGFIFVRLVKLLIIAGFAIGRIDRPFLAEGVGRINGVEIDNYPSIHLRDILAHEAHRHPLIQLLGTMYLMKLRYGDRFCRGAGSCWRLIFVYALMPWLHKYRIATRPTIARPIKADIEKQYSEPLSIMHSHGVDSVSHGSFESEDLHLVQKADTSPTKSIHEESEGDDKSESESTPSI